MAIILRFDGAGKSRCLLTNRGDTLSFIDKVNKAQVEGFLPPARATELKQVKSYGDSGAHSFRVVIDERDVQHAMTLLRSSLGELFPDSQASK